MNQEARLVRDLDLALRKKSRKEAREKWTKAMQKINTGNTETFGCMGEAEERCCANAVGKCDVWPGACRVCRNNMPATGATTCDACQHKLFPEHMLVLKPVSDKVKVSLQQQRIEDMSETIETLKESSRTAQKEAKQYTEKVMLKIDSKVDKVQKDAEQHTKDILLKMDAIMKRLDEQFGGGQAQRRDDATQGRI